MERRLNYPLLIIFLSVFVPSLYLFFTFIRMSRSLFLLVFIGIEGGERDKIEIRGGRVGGERVFFFFVFLCQTPFFLFILHLYFLFLRRLLRLCVSVNGTRRSREGSSSSSSGGGRTPSRCCSFRFSFLAAASALLFCLPFLLLPKPAPSRSQDADPVPGLDLHGGLAPQVDD